MTTRAINGSAPGYTTRIITPVDAGIDNDRCVTSVGTYSGDAALAALANWVMQIATFRAPGQQAG